MLSKSDWYPWMSLSQGISMAIHLFLESIAPFNSYIVAVFQHMGCMGRFRKAMHERPGTGGRRTMQRILR